MRKSINWFKKNTITILFVVLTIILTGCFEKEDNKEDVEKIPSGEIIAVKQFDVQEFFGKIDDMFKETTGSFSVQEINELYKFENIKTEDMRCYVVEDNENYIELFVAYSKDSKELENMIPNLIERSSLVRNQVTNETLKTELEKVESVVIKNDKDLMIFIISNDAQEYARNVEMCRATSTK